MGNIKLHGLSFKSRKMQKIVRIIIAIYNAFTHKQSLVGIANPKSKVVLFYTNFIYGGNRSYGNFMGRKTTGGYQASILLLLPLVPLDKTY